LYKINKLLLTEVDAAFCKQMNYTDWNHKILNRFFTPDNEGKRVFLAVTKELIEEIGGPGGIQDFIVAVKTGPSAGSTSRLGLCARILKATEEWRQQGSLEVPPYIATLGLFVLAASFDKEEEFKSYGYHKRLRELLGEPEDNQPISKFYDCIEIWDDLEKWANVDRSGELGTFRVEFSGKWMYVGVPISQTLLTEKEKALLPDVFAAAGLDPGIQYSDEHLAREVSRFGIGHLLRRTINRLKGSDQTEPEFRHLLIEQVHDELENFETSWVASNTSNGVRCRRPRPMRLLVNLHYDPIAQVAQTKLIFDARSFEDTTSFSLYALGAKKTFTVKAEQNSWSYPVNSEKGVVQATEFNWQNGERFQIDTYGIEFIFAGGDFRVFEAKTDGVGYLLECARLPPRGPFWLAVSERSSELVHWGASCCEGWQELAISDGLPRGWRFFRADRALSTSAIEKKYPALSLPIFAKILLVGGLKLGRANRYLGSCPPALSAQTPPEEFVLTCNGERISLDAFPASVPSELLRERNIIELYPQSDPERARRISFYLIGSDSIGWKTGIEYGRSSAGGSVFQENGPLISGALVAGAEVPPYPLQDTFERESLILLGKYPGQIAQGKSPVGWDPVWAVSKGRNRRVFFCGDSVENCAPIKRSQEDRKAIRRWKEVIYNERKTIQPPRHRRLAGLWSQYISVASDV